MAQTFIHKAAKCTAVKLRNHSLNGNASFWMTFELPNGSVVKGYTKPNSMVSYKAENSEDHVMDVEYKLTTSGKMVIIDLQNSK